MIIKKVNTSLRLDDDLKSRFLKELELDCLTMTEVFEGFMENYIKIKEDGRKQ